jgi:hypothetical protein
MERLKKHYEKILLGVVFLGLIVAVGLLPVLISTERQRLDAAAGEITRRKPKLLDPVPMAAENAALERAQTPIRLNFTLNHNLFNPVLWQKTADGRPVKVQAGREPADEVQVTDIKPLYLKLTFNNVSGSSYLIGVENQAASQPGKRNRETAISMNNPKTDLFTLQGVKGPPDKPTELDLTLVENDEVVSITPSTSYQRVAGYMADLKYPPENKVWRGQRVSANLLFAGGQYNVVGITETNVVLSAKENEKKTTIPFNSPNAVTETR